MVYKQTYDNYFKKYWQKNREHIMEVSGEARKKANLSYYYRNRNEILAKRVAKRLEQKLVKAILKNGIHKRVI